jgi:hypothetical protein
MVLLLTLVLSVRAGDITANSPGQNLDCGQLKSYLHLKIMLANQSQQLMQKCFTDATLPMCLDVVSIVRGAYVSVFDATNQFELSCKHFVGREALAGEYFKRLEVLMQQYKKSFSNLDAIEEKIKKRRTGNSH